MIKRYGFEIYINKNNNIAIKQRGYGDEGDVVEIGISQFDDFIQSLKSVADTVRPEEKIG